jgi:hypothetical protein
VINRTVDSNKAKGERLEQQVAAFFAANGYSVTSNAILEGTSGGKHEIDVLAEKSDGVTRFAVAIECKAWQTPIEKDIISKLAYILGDLGINKGIIVSLSGWMVGAELAAQRLGIDLWGPEEIAARLGATATAAVEHRPATRTVEGFPQQVASEQLHLMLTSETKGLFGLSREELVWSGLIWLPFYALEIRCSKMEKELFRKAALKATPIWNLYSGLDGSLYVHFADQPHFHQLPAEVLILPKTKERQIRSELKQAMDKRASVVTASARSRHTATLSAMGIPPLVEHVSIDASREVYEPFYIGILQRGGKDRIVAIDAYRGHKSDSMSQTLTAHLRYVVESLGRAYQKTAS